MASSDGIAFIADGAILPRRGGADDAPMELAQGVVPFESPPSLRREFELPHRGRITGMLVPREVTLIVGGGYHGEDVRLRYMFRTCHRLKSSLDQALRSLVPSITFFSLGFASVLSEKRL